MPLPVVAIVGRPNVGKSSLFNRLVGRQIAIVDQTSGVTRDRVTAEATHAGRRFELTDTGGLLHGDADPLAADVERQIKAAMRRASVVVFVVDVRDGVVPLDRSIAARMRALEKHVILAVNKADTARLAQEAGEFFSLGLGEPIPVSAREGLGRTELLEAITARLGPQEGDERQPEPALLLAIVGRRNVGKSTFINGLAREERVIVSEQPGTTRDSVDVRFEREGRSFVAIDTAGMQRRSRLADSIQFYSQVRTARSIRRCDVAVFMLDATVEIGRVDKQLAGLLVEQHKPCVIAVNKWDLRGQATTDAYRRYLEAHLPSLSFAPIVFTTARTGRHLTSVIDLAQALDRQARTRVTTGELNRVIREALEARRPRPRGNRMPKVFYATQTAIRPPTVVLFVNDPRLFDAGYRRYLANRLRGALPYAEVPIDLRWRARGRQTEATGSSPPTARKRRSVMKKK